MNNAHSVQENITEFHRTASDIAGEFGYDFAYIMDYIAVIGGRLMNHVQMGGRPYNASNQIRH